MQTYGNFSWIFSQITKTFSYVATKTLSLEFIKDKKNMTHNEFLHSIKQMAADIPFLQTILTYDQLFTLLPMNNFAISQQRFQVIQNDQQKIGAGANSQVFLAIDYVNDYQIAMKIIDDVDENKQECYFQECINQYNLQKINGDLILNILSKVFVNFINYKATFQLPLELAEFSLFDYIQEYEINEETYQYFFNLFIDILILLHENKYAHRDIKPHNILFVKDKGWKLADFGESIKYEEAKGAYRIQGTIAFMPKDIIKQIYKNKEITQDLFYNDIYSVVCTLVLLKNPNFTSKKLIDFMENQNLDYQCQLLLKIDHPNQLKANKFQQQISLQFNIIRKNSEKIIQYDLEYILVLAYYDKQPFLKEKILSFINHELKKFENNNFKQYQKVMVLILLLHPFQFDLIVHQNYENFKLDDSIFIDTLAYQQINFQNLLIYLKSIQNIDLITNLIKDFIEFKKLINLLLVIDEFYDEFPINFCKKLLDLVGSYLLRDRDQIDSPTIIIYNQIYQKVLGEDPKFIQSNMDQSEIDVQDQQILQSDEQSDDFNYDFNCDSNYDFVYNFYVNENKNYLDMENKINLFLLFNPLLYYQTDQITNDKVMVFITQQLKQISSQDDTIQQKLSQILKYHLIQGGSRLYLKEIHIIIKGVIKIFVHFDLFFDLLDLLYYFDSFMILKENHIKLFLLTKIQNLVLKLNIQTNLQKQFAQIDSLIEFNGSYVKFRLFCQKAQLYLIAVQQTQICENQKIQYQFQDAEQMGQDFFYVLSKFITDQTEIIYQSDKLLYISVEIVEVLEHQKFQQQKYLRILILILIKFLYTDNFYIKYLSIKFNHERLRLYDNILLHFYFESKQYQRVNLLIKDWLSYPKIRIINQGIHLLIAKTKMMKLNLNIRMEKLIFEQVLINFTINQKHRYFFNLRQHLFALKVVPSLKKRIKIDNLNLREQYMLI